MRTTLALVFLLAACNQPSGTSGNAPVVPAPALPSAVVPSETGSETVAFLHGQPITLAEVDREAGADLMQARQQMYDARRNALEKMVIERLLDEEAKKRSITRDELLKVEVEDKVPAPAESEIVQLFEENKARLQGQTLEEVRPRIVQFLSQKARAERMQAFAAELKAAADVKIMLDPPRIAVPVPETAPRYGSPSAPVQIVEFSDFQCPYCSRASQTLTELKEKYGDKISIVFRHFPLDFHKEAQKAAEAAACAQEEGKFWEYHDLLFANQRALGVDSLKEYAAKLGLDAGRFATCLDSGKYAATVAADLEAGKAAGVQGTPGFFVNGRFLGGALPTEEFSKIIDEELARLN